MRKSKIYFFTLILGDLEGAGGKLSPYSCFCTPKVKVLMSSFRFRWCSFWVGTIFFGSPIKSSLWEPFNSAHIRCKTNLPSQDANFTISELRKLNSTKFYVDRKWWLFLEIIWSSCPEVPQILFEYFFVKHFIHFDL